MNPVDPGVPIVDEEGTVTQAFAAFVLQVFKQSTLYGSGSPEGLIEGGLTQQYMDEDAATGSILYIKQKTDIAGDRKKGWTIV